MISGNVSSRVTLIPCLARLREMIRPTGPAPTITTSESRDGILTDLCRGVWIGNDLPFNCANSCGDLWGKRSPEQESGICRRQGFGCYSLKIFHLGHEK